MKPEYKYELWPCGGTLETKFKHKFEVIEFTGYEVGGIERGWVSRGFMSEEEFKKNFNPQEEEIFIIAGNTICQECKEEISELIGWRLL